MKKNALLFFPSFLLTVQLSAQPVLNQANFSTANEAYVYSTATDPEIDYSSTGGNFTWDFSYLVADGQTGFNNRPMSQASTLSNIFFGPFAYQQYQANYFAKTTDIPIAELTAALPITIDEISRFTKNSSTAITSVGYEFIISGQGVAAKSDTIETRYALPLEFGDTYNSRGYTKLNMNPIFDAEWRQHRYRESAVDGYGTVITPWGTFTALRVHHRIEETDSFYVNYNGNEFWLPIPVPEAHEYEWRSVDDKEPVMLVKTSVVLGEEIVTAINYRDEYNALGLETETIEMNVFPNPTADVVEVQSDSELLSWNLIDTKGRIVMSGTANGKTLSISVKDIESGNYVVLIETQNGYKSANITKK